MIISHRAWIRGSVLHASRESTARSERGARSGGFELQRLVAAGGAAGEATASGAAAAGADDSNSG